MRLPISAFVMVTNDSYTHRQFLLLKRKPIPAFGVKSFWQGITGGVEQGESVSQAAYRELLEETSLRPKIIEKVDCVYSYSLLPAWKHRYTSDVTTIKEHVFVAIIDRIQSPILSDEHIEYQWCTYSQALELLYFDENKRALTACQHYLNAM